MDPFSIAIELELATLILAGVGTLATWLHHKRDVHAAEAKERHHQDLKELHERHHRERMTAIAGAPVEIFEDLEIGGIK